MYVEETERLQTEGVGGWVGEGLGLGRRGELKDDGLINAIVFSCGSVATYLTGVDVRRWRAGPPTSVRRPPKKRGEEKQKANQPLFFFCLHFFFCQLANWIAGTNWMENQSGRAVDPIYLFHFLFQEGQTMEWPS